MKRLIEGIKLPSQLGPYQPAGPSSPPWPSSQAVSSSQVGLPISQADQLAIQRAVATSARPVASRGTLTDWIPFDTDERMRAFFTGEGSQERIQLLEEYVAKYVDRKRLGSSSLHMLMTARYRACHFWEDDRVR